MPLKYLIRIRLQDSNIQFDDEFAPGIITVAQIRLEKPPEDLDKIMQQIKMRILHTMFTVEFIEDDSAIEIMPILEESAMAYVQ